MQRMASYLPSTICSVMPALSNESLIVPGSGKSEGDGACHQLSIPIFLSTEKLVHSNANRFDNLSKESPKQEVVPPDTLVSFGGFTSGLLIVCCGGGTAADDDDSAGGASESENRFSPRTLGAPLVLTSFGAF